MIKRIKEQIKQQHMLEKEDRVLIGLSGGADSICLAEILYRIREEFQLTLGAVYCHHGIRGEEADQDGIFVKNFCQERNISYYEAYEKVEERAVSCKISIEEAGREFRYETFERLMGEGGYTKLALAHHANDRAETMLFHLARGTGLQGLCTMEAVRKFGDNRTILRPLLWTERQEIEHWLLEQNLSWRVDSTNKTDIYTRNQIRHQVIPVLKHVNERAVQHMGETADGIGEAVSFLQIEQEKALHTCVKWCEDGNRASISIPKWKDMHIYMKKAVLYQALVRIIGSKKDISAVHVKMLLDLLEGQSGREISLGKKVYARKEYEECCLYRKEEFVEEASSDTLNIQLNMEICPYEGQEISKNKYTKYFDCDKIKDNLVLRHWKEGDYLYLREDGGKKKLNRYFIDEKIPPDKRKEIPLLAEGSHVLWVIGYRISAYYKVTEQTKNIIIINVQNEE